MSTRIDAVLLDLDGTLADTGPDLAAALNRLLQEQGRTKLSYPVIRPVVSQGGGALIRLAFPDVSDTGLQNQLRQRFLDLYADALHVDGHLFPGMDEALRQIEASERRWGIVTNKPSWLATPLIEALALSDRCGCLVCGNQVARPKPHPESVLRACSLLQVPPASAVFVGDDRRDIDAGRATGTYTLAAAWGYLGPGETPDDWTADAVIDAPAAILDWLEAGNRFTTDTG